LPDDRVAHGFAGFGVPGQGGFALIGDAQSTDRGLFNAGFLDDVLDDREGIGQDLDRIVLDPAALVDDLAVRPVSAADQVAGGRKQQRLGARGALVDG
jgi:hypothetical protein